MQQFSNLICGKRCLTENFKSSKLIIGMAIKSVKTFFGVCRGTMPTDLMFVKTPE